MHALTTHFVDGTSKSKTLVWLGLSILFISSFALYFVPVITAETGGLRPIDTQVPLTAEVIYRDLVYPTATPTEVALTKSFTHFYDNTTSGLTAENVQDAIDEIASTASTVSI